MAAGNAKGEALSTFRIAVEMNTHKGGFSFPPLWVFFFCDKLAQLFPTLKLAAV